MANVKTYRSGHAPYSYERYERIKKEKLTHEQRSRVVAYEDCDGGNGRCKCDQYCTWAVVERKQPTQ